MRKCERSGVKCGHVVLITPESQSYLIHAFAFAGVVRVLLRHVAKEQVGGGEGRLGAGKGVKGGIWAWGE